MIKFYEVIMTGEKFTQTDKTKKPYTIKEVWINNNDVVKLSLDETMVNHLKMGLLPEGLNEHTRFTKVIMKSGTIVVAGSPEEVSKKLNGNKKIKEKMLLKG